MADDADIAQAKMESEEALQIKEIRRRAAAIPVGKPGDCKFCGEWSGRLVNGGCAPCRDRRHLP